MIISLNDCIMSLENMQRSERKASIKSIIKPQGSKFRTARVEFSEVRLEEQWSTVTVLTQGLLLSTSRVHSLEIPLFNYLFLYLEQPATSFCRPIPRILNIT